MHSHQVPSHADQLPFSADGLHSTEQELAETHNGLDRSEVKLCDILDNKTGQMTFGQPVVQGRWQQEECFPINLAERMTYSCWASVEIFNAREF